VKEKNANMRFARYAAESGSAPPEVPIIFLRTPNTVVGPNHTVSIPRTSTKIDWEVKGNDHGSRI
jgi:2-keto-4-pentenoate hydratase/2-oxohepta-3-ene-1,7-dioic acid hydratase in catechol pathway